MRKYLILILLIIPYYSLKAQNTTNSPVSMFGIGEIAYGEGGQYAGMGGAGIALQSGTFINYANPAAIASMDSANFVLDMGLRGSYRIFRQSGQNSNSFNGNLNNLSIGFRMKPWLYGAAFLVPVSSCGYAATLTQDVIGTIGSTESSLFEGEGGLSRAGLSGAVLLFKSLSIGASASYVTGVITQSETQSSASKEVTSRKQGFYCDFGAQYTYNIGKRRSFTFGAVYALSQPLHQHNHMTVSSSNGGTTIDKDILHTRQYLPGFYGFGIAYAQDRWQVTADYRYYDWSESESSVSNVVYKNQNMLMLGGQYIMGNLYRRPVKFMAGAGISNSYVVVSHKEAKNYYVSAGMNFVFRGNGKLAIGVKYNDQFNSATNMQRDKGIAMFLNISFCERIWHSKIQ